MKRYRYMGILMALALIFTAFSGCGKSSELSDLAERLLVTPSPTAAPTVAPTPTATPEPLPMTPSKDDILVAIDETKTFIEECIYAPNAIIEEEYRYSDVNPPYDENGNQIPCRVDNKYFSTYAEFLREAERHVCPDTAKELVDEVGAQDIDGRLYITPSLGLGGVGYEGTVYICELDRDTFILDFPHHVVYSPEYQFDVTIQYVRTDEGWVFSGTKEEIWDFFMGLLYSSEVEYIYGERAPIPTSEPVSDDESYFGTYTVTECVTHGRIFALSEPEENFIGETVTYSADSFACSKNQAMESNVSYSEKSVSFMDAFYNSADPPKELKEKLGIDSDSLIDVTIEGMYSFGTSFLVLDNNTIVICFDGVFFMAKK